MFLGKQLMLVNCGRCYVIYFKTRENAAIELAHWQRMRFGEREAGENWAVCWPPDEK